MASSVAVVQSGTGLTTTKPTAVHAAVKAKKTSHGTLGSCLPPVFKGFVDQFRHYTHAFAHLLVRFLSHHGLRSPAMSSLEKSSTASLY
jgi:hypothetical protein